jgi:hypothetical protein
VTAPGRRRDDAPHPGIAAAAAVSIARMCHARPGCDEYGMQHAGQSEVGDEVA